MAESLVEGEGHHPQAEDPELRWVSVSPWGARSLCKNNPRSRGLDGTSEGHGSTGPCWPVGGTLV